MSYSLSVLARDFWIMFAVTGSATMLLTASIRWLYRRRKGLLEP